MIITTAVINSNITTTAATAAPTIIPTDGDDVWLVPSEDASQSFESNESSIVGQLESMSRVTLFTLTDGSDSTHSFSTVIILSASVTEAATCKVIIARYTTVFLNSPCDPLQLKVSSMMLLEVNSQEQRISTWRIISALMSLCFCSSSSTYNNYTYIYIASWILVICWLFYHA